MPQEAKNAIMQNVERSRSPEAAIKLVLKDLRQLGLTPRVRSIGTQHRSYECFLSDDRQVSVASGLGKGLGMQAVASAIFEALEHYFSMEVDRISQPLYFEPTTEIAAQPIIRDEKVFELLEKSGKEDDIPCYRYDNISRTKSLILPIFLLVPGYVDRPFPADTFDYQLYAKYITNSGTAVGCSLDEALIHATCEIIERDAISTFMLGTFFAETPPPISLIDKKSLPARLSKLCQVVEEETSSPLTIIDITNDLDVPSYLVLLQVSRRLESAIEIRGFGTSLSPSYALERALLETLQGWHVQSPYLERLTQLRLKSLIPFPRHLACFRFDVWPMLDAGHFVVNEFKPENSEKLADSDLAEYLNLLIRKIDSAGLDLYYVSYSVSQNGVYCVNCKIPGIEYFFLTIAGQPVLPGQRGLRLLKRLSPSSR